MGFQSPTLIFGHRDGTESVDGQNDAPPRETLRKKPRKHLCQQRKDAAPRAPRFQCCGCEKSGLRWCNHFVHSRQHPCPSPKIKIGGRGGCALFKMRRAPVCTTSPGGASFCPSTVPPRSFYPLVLLFLSFPPSLVYFGRPPETKANKTRRKTRPRRRKRGQKDRDEERAEGRRTLT